LTKQRNYHGGETKNNLSLHATLYQSYIDH